MLSVCLPFELNFHRTWNEHYTFGIHPKTVYFLFLLFYLSVLAIRNSNMTVTNLQGGNIITYLLHGAESFFSS